MTETPPPNEQTKRTLAYTSLGTAAVAWLIGGPIVFAGIFFTPALICGGIVYLLGSILAIVTGNRARKQARESGDEGAGKMATAGLALGTAGTAISLLIACALGALLIARPAINNVYSNVVQEQDRSPATDDGFTRHQTSDFSELVAGAPTLTLEHPSDWDVGWVSDSGLTALMLTSGSDVQEVFWNTQLPEASILIFMGQRDSEGLRSLFQPRGESEVLEEPTPITINGLDASKVVFIRGDEMKINVLINYGEFGFLLKASFPADQEAQFRPTVERIINSVELN